MLDERENKLGVVRGYVGERDAGMGDVDVVVTDQRVGQKTLCVSVNQAGFFTCSEVNIVLVNSGIIVRDTADHYYFSVLFLYGGQQRPREKIGGDEVYLKDVFVACGAYVSRNVISSRVEDDKVGRIREKLICGSFDGVHSFKIKLDIGDGDAGEFFSEAFAEKP